MNRVPRAEFVLPFVIVLAGVVLIASEFMIAFQFTPPGGEALKQVSNADRHHYSMLVLGLAAIIAMGIAIATGARSAAYAVAGLGAAALLLFLVLDLPDAGKLGDLEDPIRGFASAKAVPQPGFWLEAIGAVTLALGGGAFATLDSNQLQAPLTWFRNRSTRRAAKGTGSGPSGSLPFDQDAKGDAGEGEPITPSPDSPKPTR